MIAGLIALAGLAAMAISFFILWRQAEKTCELDNMQQAMRVSYLRDENKRLRERVLIFRGELNRIQTVIDDLEVLGKDGLHFEEKPLDPGHGVF